jgi:hypothetical protein
MSGFPFSAMFPIWDSAGGRFELWREIGSCGGPMCRPLKYEGKGDCL